MFNQSAQMNGPVNPTAKQSTLSLVDVSVGRDSTKEAPRSFQGCNLSIPNTPTIMIPHSSVHRLSSNYTYSTSDPFGSSESSTIIDSLFDPSETMSWSPDSFFDSTQSEAASWSPNLLTETLQGLAQTSQEEEVFFMEDDQALPPSSAAILAQTNVKQETSLPPSSLGLFSQSANFSSNIIPPSSMHLTDHHIPAPEPFTHPSPIISSWLDQALANHTPEMADTVTTQRRTHSESPAPQQYYQTSSATRSGYNAEPQLSNSLPQLHSTTNFSSPYAFTPIELSQLEQDISSPMSFCSSLPASSLNSAIGTPEPQQDGSDMFSILSNWDFVNSHQQNNRGESPRGSTVTTIGGTKRRASGCVAEATQSRRKVAKSFRRFSSLSKEVDVFDGNSDVEDTVSTSSRSGQSSSMSFSISQTITLKPKPGCSQEENEEIVYPEDLELYRQTLVAQGPQASGPDETPVETNTSVIQRSHAGELDIYTPRWSRGAHRERDGWCHLCEQGGWYSMKRSQYLYHLQYDHGVSSQTKKVFEPPKAMRVWNDAVQSTEGLCGTCNSWIPICFGPVRKRNFKVYFKHIHACQRRHSE